MSKDSCSRRARIFRHSHQDKETLATDPPLGTGTSGPMEQRELRRGRNEKGSEELTPAPDAPSD